jgi:hypothetical protein
MNEQQFCYWLQGYFELLDASGCQHPSSMPNAFYDCILAHIGIVDAHAQNQKDKNSILINAIDEIRFLAKYRLPLLEIQNILHSCFTNVIDIKSNNDSLHKPLGAWEPNQKLKC